jgi:RNA polymerase sigma-70 factor (ECF subfamily)
MNPQASDTDELLRRATQGDDDARQRLLDRHRGRLRQMVAVRVDRRLSARVDPSDVVQEALAEASRHLDDYLRDRPIAFYPWLRQFAWERLVALHRRHVLAGKRSVTREECNDVLLSDESTGALADRLLAPGTSPSHRVLRDELLDRVRDALTRLTPKDREVLVMRHLEQLSTGEVAALLGISQGAVMTRQTRALVRLRALLDDEPREGPSRP